MEHFKRWIKFILYKLGILQLKINIRGQCLLQYLKDNQLNPNYTIQAYETDINNFMERFGYTREEAISRIIVILSSHM